jgi:hypothetical protein
VVRYVGKAQQLYHGLGSAASGIPALQEGSDAVNMTSLRLYEKLRLYSPLGLLFEPGANMPPNATVGLPLCLLCQSRSEMPPAKVGWVKPDGETRLFMICGSCDDGEDDVALERRIIEKVSEQAPAALVAAT